MFLEQVFHGNFIFSILAKCVCDESCRGDLVPDSPKGPKLVGQTDFFLHIDENFAID